MSNTNLSGVRESPGGRAHLAPATRIELIPLKSVERHIDDLPPKSQLSVTCSPTHGVKATAGLVAVLKARGHDAIPHIAARQLRSQAHLRDLVTEYDRLGVTEAFVIAGDAQPDGPYREALDVARAYHEMSTTIRGFGFAAYPDGHSLIDAERLSQALARKQAFLGAAGLHGYLSTQMCFDATTIAVWLRETRAAGIHLPVHLGVPGRVDRLKLATISARLGVGSSLAFLKKNKTSALKLLASSHYEPTELIDDVLAHQSTITGLHVFSFNNVCPTLAWLDHYLSDQQR